MRKLIQAIRTYYILLFAKEKARTIVRYLEQSPAFFDYDGADKKEWAMVNFNVDDEVMADSLIEEAVFDMKSDLTKGGKDVDFSRANE